MDAKSGPRRTAPPSARPGQGDARPTRRAQPPPLPRRQPADRAKVIFSVVGLLVIVSLVLGSVLYGLDAGIPEEQDLAPPRSQANLVPTYEARLRADPNDLQAMLLLANILQNSGDYPGAIAWYERAVALRPDDLPTRLAFGQALASYGQRFDAEAQYRKALELDPNNAQAEYYLGQLYARWDPSRTEDARRHYTRASDLQPEGTWGRAAREALDRLNATPTR